MVGFAFIDCMRTPTDGVSYSAGKWYAIRADKVEPCCGETDACSQGPHDGSDACHVLLLAAANGQHVCTLKVLLPDHAEFSIACPS